MAFFRNNAGAITELAAPPARTATVRHACARVPFGRALSCRHGFCSHVSVRMRQNPVPTSRLSCTRHAQSPSRVADYTYGLMEDHTGLSTALAIGSLNRPSCTPTPVILRMFSYHHHLFVGNLHSTGPDISETARTLAASPRSPTTRLARLFRRRIYFSPSQEDSSPDWPGPQPRLHLVVFVLSMMPHACTVYASFGMHLTTNCQVHGIGVPPSALLLQHVWSPGFRIPLRPWFPRISVPIEMQSHSNVGPTQTAPTPEGRPKGTTRHSVHPGQPRF